MSKHIIIAANPERLNAIHPLLESLYANQYTFSYIYREAKVDQYREIIKRIVHLFSIRTMVLPHPASFLELSLFKTSWLKKLFLHSRHFSWYQKLEEYFFSHMLNDDYKRIEKAYHSSPIHSIIIISDKYYGDGEMALIRFGKNHAIPIILPYTFYQGPTIAAFLNNPRFTLTKQSSYYQHHTFERFNDTIFGQQTYKKHFFYSAPMLNALNHFRTLPKNPWYNGSGQSDYVLVDTSHTQQRYQEEGDIPESKIIVFGELIYDHLYTILHSKATTREQIVKRYWLDPNKQIVVLSIPPLWEHNLLSQERHAIEIAFLLETYQKLSNQANLLISLHPKNSPDEYRQWLQTAPCTLLDLPLSHVIPIADLFTTSYSSTVMWAILSHVPSVVFDLYDFNYTMYDIFTSVTIVKDRNTLLSEWEKALDRTTNFEDDWKLLKRDMVFDGQVRQRHIDFFNTIPEGTK